MMGTLAWFWWAFMTFPAAMVRSVDMRGHTASAVGHAWAPSDGLCLARRWQRRCGTPASGSMPRKVISLRCGLPAAHGTVLPVPCTPGPAGPVATA